MGGGWGVWALTAAHTLSQPSASPHTKKEGGVRRDEDAEKRDGKLRLKVMKTRRTN